MLRFASLLLMVCFGLDADAACIDQPENPTTRPKCSGGEGLLDVCQRSGHSMICDMNRNGSSDGAWAVAIKDDTATQVFCGSDYCAWGTDGAGNSFFCPWTDFDGDLTHVRLIGTEHVDNLYFWYDHPQYPNQDLDAWGSSDLTGQMYGNEEDDCLDGSSRDIYGYYYEELFGDDGNDVILGRGGLHDTVFAGGGDDQVTTGPGNDTVFLGGGNDECWTDAGNDTVAGGTGHDEVCAGDGDDSVDAGSGNDWVNAGSDTPFGDDYVDGGDGNDQCYAAEGTNNCEDDDELSCP